ncbi:HAD-IIIA family hydrolase [Olivibacter sp. XZL3]|uniref:D-glycero-alpha-D-manno-heptose-1,7-bisphosphate 7-phosphatase n=1 Tax=Olivibacter sp. XZL3 TaxID=1735116 RepID=UPI00106718D0|nr:HAD family hydrolase [Olivibacter sp. XZL3]
MQASKKAIFLDKDGTLIPDIPYNVDTSKITLEKGVVEGLHLLAEQDFRFIIVTNQSGIAKGLFTEDAIFEVKAALAQLFAKEGLPLFEGFYFCPHHPEGVVPRFSYSCTCRKPLPGLLEQAADDHHISLSRSWMFGDILNDVEAGNRAGCKSILINNGNETEWIDDGLYRRPFFVASDFLEAANKVVAYSKMSDYEPKAARINTSI